MQPAVAEVVQNSTLPASAARASARFGAIMSIPWCAPPARGSPKSSVYCVCPSTGKTIVVGGFLVLADAVPATIATARRRVPRIVVRKRFTGGRRAGRYQRSGLYPRGRNEDRGLRQIRPGRRRARADRPADEAARPLGRGRAEPVRRARRRGGL